MASKPLPMRNIINPGRGLRLESRYWVAFKIHNADGWELTCEERTRGLQDQLRSTLKQSDLWWQGAANFCLFSSIYSLDYIAKRAKLSIDESVDSVVIIDINTRSRRIIGNLIDPDMLALLSNRSSSRTR